MSFLNCFDAGGSLFFELHSTREERASSDDLAVNVYLVYPISPEAPPGTAGFNVGLCSDPTWGWEQRCNVCANV